MHCVQLSLFGFEPEEPELEITITEILPTLAELIERRALFVVSHSGGKDSQAMLIVLLTLIPKELLLVVHAALGEVEWDGAKELAESQARAAGLPFIIAASNTKTFLSMVEKRFADRPEVPSWPSPSTRQCTSDLKRGPIQREVRRYAKEHGFTTVVNCMGLRAQESSTRSKLSEWRRDWSASSKTRNWYDWLPIHELSTREVFDTITNAGQMPHWAYSLGNERLSCIFCIYGSANDLRNGALQRPALYEKYVQLEQTTGYTMHVSRKSLPELTQLTVAQAYEGTPPIEYENLAA